MDKYKRTCDRCSSYMGDSGWVIQGMSLNRNQARREAYRLCERCIADFEENMLKFCSEGVTI